MKRNTSQNKHFYQDSGSIFELKTLIDTLQINLCRKNLFSNHPMKPNNCNTIAIEQQLKNDEKL